MKLLVSFIVLSLVYLVSSRSTGGRVVGGSTAPPGSGPFMVSLQIFRQHQCGGAIIRDRWVRQAQVLKKLILNNNLLVDINRSSLS